MYITYKIIHFSPNFVGIRMPTSGMTCKMPNDLKLLLMAVCRYLFIIQGCPHSIIIFWEKDRNRRDSAFSTKVEKTEYDAILFLMTMRFLHSAFSTQWKTRSLHELGLRTPHSALRTPYSVLRLFH